MRSSPLWMFVLGTSLVACRSKSSETRFDPSVDRAVVRLADEVAPEPEDTPDDGEGQPTRERAIEQARQAGVLGHAKVHGGMASVTGNGDVSSGFDDSSTGTAMALEEGKLGKKDGGGFGFGRSGYGPGGGGIGAIGRGRYARDAAGAEHYTDHGKHAWTVTKQDRVSTFAADVDTASYSIARKKLESGVLPPPASVRVEEMVNYFRYRFPEPTGASPFAVVIDGAVSPFAADRRILRVGVATKPKSIVERKPANLVFLVDVSGSMASADKLGLAKRSLRILVDNLTDRDTVAIATYAGDTRLVLPATGIAKKQAILDAIEGLEPSGGTAMGSGLDLAYKQAMKGLRGGAISRVIVLSDGDANIGAGTHQELLQIIAGRAKEGVTLSTIGFGMGNYKDTLMEQLANKGNGNNYYIDGISQARRVFQEQLAGTLEVVAKDVKLQVELDPALVARYRLIGYENRDVADADFRNDKVDAGEIGAGHQVTALYELELTAAGMRATSGLATVRTRHKAPDDEKATEHAFAMQGTPHQPFASASDDLRFAFAVAAFADVMRGGDDAKAWSLAKIQDLARGATANLSDRLAFVALIGKAIALAPRTS